MDSWTGNLLLLFVGCIAGLLNVIAGGGSFLTLPILIFLGLPATIANGTNRLAILLQNIGAVWGFSRHRIVNWNSLLWAALPACLGSVFGTWMSLMITDRTFQRTLAFLMIAMTILSLWKPTYQQHSAEEIIKRRGLLLAASFFLVGVYGGFIQAGVGFLILAVISLSGLDLVRGNAVKVLCILCFTAVSLSIFTIQGMVRLYPGPILGIGTVIGGQIGVKLTIRKGHKWIRGFVTMAVFFFAIKLWLQS